MFSIRRLFSAFGSKFVACFISPKTACKKPQSVAPYVAYVKNRVCPILDVDIGFDL
jgi:hypothetical protein